MLKKIRQVLKKKGGFSLIELLVVIAILGVISLIAVPNVISAVNTSKYNTDRTNAASIATAITTAKSQGDSVTNSATPIKLVNTAATDEYVDKFVPKYLQSVPTVKGTKNDSSFYVTVADNKVTVYAHTGSGTDLDDDFAEIFPEPKGDWAEK